MCLGIPGQIVAISDAKQNIAIVDIGGIKRQVNITCIVDETHSPESCLGDWVLVHVGFALNRLDEEEANKTLELLNELAQVQEELLTVES